MKKFVGGSVVDVDNDNVGKEDVRSHERPGERIAFLLGLAGLAPFIACVVLLLLTVSGNVMFYPVLEVFIYYSIVVLSFIGGIRWGYELQKANPHEDNDSNYNLSGHTLILASLLPVLAWATVFMPPSASVGLLMLLYCLQGVWDSFSTQVGRYSTWFAKQRMLQTILVVVCHALVFLAIEIS